ncbi:movement protein 1 [Sugarcane striate mosaic-associated virus]|uniref:Movement protein 1 n=1 Tax=Sugarcane striate mosaic-associated virus TaxID=167927 RepID=Q91BP6_9VIRU|nr:movement protein 1 [Sugarcane striate mosaic-associated virus]AAL05445.1 movement protein 1 [Sugarcane striate mosaic-associated virus]
MEIVCRYLDDFKFERTSLELSSPIVVHAVPGSGKSTLIRKCITENPSLTACTFGKPDLPNLTGTYIKGYKEGEKYDIIDEYIGNRFECVPVALFSDPFQNCEQYINTAHYIGRTSHRFGVVLLSYCAGLVIKFPHLAKTRSLRVQVTLLNLQVLSYALSLTLRTIYLHITSSLFIPWTSAERLLTKLHSIILVISAILLVLSYIFR